MSDPANVDWSQTSFADAIECAIHYSMVDFSMDVQWRQDEQGVLCNLSDIYISYRRLIRSFVTDKEKALQYLRERE